MGASRRRAAACAKPQGHRRPTQVPLAPKQALGGAEREVYGDASASHSSGSAAEGGAVPAPAAAGPLPSFEEQVEDFSSSSAAGGSAERPADPLAGAPSTVALSTDQLLKEPFSEVTLPLWSGAVASSVEPDTATRGYGSQEAGTPAGIGKPLSFTAWLTPGSAVGRPESLEREACGPADSGEIAELPHTPVQEAEFSLEEQEVVSKFLSSLTSPQRSQEGSLRTAPTAEEASGSASGRTIASQPPGGFFEEAYPGGAADLRADEGDRAAQGVAGPLSAPASHGCGRLQIRPFGVAAQITLVPIIDMAGGDYDDEGNEVCDMCCL